MGIWPRVSSALKPVWSLPIDEVREAIPNWISRPRAAISRYPSGYRSFSVQRRDTRTNSRERAASSTSTTVIETPTTVIETPTTGTETPTTGTETPHARLQTPTNRIEPVDHARRARRPTASNSSTNRIEPVDRPHRVRRRPGRTSRQSHRACRPIESSTSTSATASNTPRVAVRIVSPCNRAIDVRPKGPVMRLSYDAIGRGLPAEYYRPKGPAKRGSYCALERAATASILGPKGPTVAQKKIGVDAALGLSPVSCTPSSAPKQRWRRLLASVPGNSRSSKDRSSRR